jgi:prenyltransferase beta subunit
MTGEMLRKEIELARIVKTSALLILSGVSPSSIDPRIAKACAESQQADGGFTGITDTLWSICLLQHYNRYTEQTVGGLQWLQDNAGENGGFGRTRRDMRRIPVTGLALYIAPQLAQGTGHLQWLERTWLKEKNTLTYKAAYTLMAFSRSNRAPEDGGLIPGASAWLAGQQEDNGGFAPWRGHPAGATIYYTALGVLGLLSYGDKLYRGEILKAYTYMKETQLPSGIWPYHEIEDGASWGLYGMSKIEEQYRNT